MVKANRYILTVLNTWMIFLLCFQVKSQELTPKEYKTLLNYTFSKLVSGETNGSIGNFASLDIVNSSANFSSSFVRENGHVINGTFTGGVTDGVSSIFSNSTLNSNVSLEIQYHIRETPLKTAITYKNLSDSYKEEKRKVEKDYSDKSFKNSEDYLIRESNIQISSKELEIEKLDKKINDPKTSEIEKKLSKLNKTKAQLELKKLKEEKKKLELDVTEIVKQNGYLIELERANKLKELKKKYKVDEDEVTGFNLNWATLSYKVSNNSFRLFDRNVELPDQIIRDNYTSHEFGYKYNVYKYTKNKAFSTWFFTIGLNVSISDNFSSLSRVEVKESQLFEGENLSRSVENSIIAYEGNYIDDILRTTLSSDFYYFLFDKNVAALHLFPSFEAGTKIKPIYNFGVGLLSTFKKKDKKSPAFNVEIFYNALDLFNSDPNNELELIERNDIGLRFTFPIAFKTKD